MVVAHQRDHAAMRRSAVEIGVAERVAGAVDARPLPVPDAEDAVEAALAPKLRLLRAPQGRGGQILVDAGLEDDVARLEQIAGAPELLVKAAERRAAIAADEAGRVEAGATIELLAHQRQANDRLRTGDENALLGEVVLVAERHPMGHTILAPINRPAKRPWPMIPPPSGSVVLRQKKIHTEMRLRPKKFALLVYLGGDR